MFMSRRSCFAVSTSPNAALQHMHEYRSSWRVASASRSGSARSARSNFLNPCMRSPEAYSALPSARRASGSGGGPNKALTRAARRDPARREGPPRDATRAERSRAAPPTMREDARRGDPRGARATLARGAAPRGDEVAPLAAVATTEARPTANIARGTGARRGSGQRGDKASDDNDPPRADRTQDEMRQEVSPSTRRGRRIIAGGESTCSG